jgi:hypothetical protein
VTLPDVTPAESNSAWRKSSASGSSNCVEVSFGDGSVSVRHSKSVTTELRFTPAEWIAFLAGVRAGEFDMTQP